MIASGGNFHVLNWEIGRSGCSIYYDILKLLLGICPEGLYSSTTKTSKPPEWKFNPRIPKYES
jgi:hypothetical protein